MSTTPVTGHGPLSFTDSNGDQRVVPLSALVFTAPGKLDINSSGSPSWKSEFGPGQPFSANDATTLLSLAALRFAAGELKPPPTLPPEPALHFQAATPGPGGNNVSIALALTTTPNTADPTVFNTTVQITAQEEEEYSGLADGAAARAAIGVDTPTDPGDQQGYGLVMVKGSSTSGTGKLAKAGSWPFHAGTLDLMSDDGLSTVVTLAPRAGMPATGVTVTVTHDVSGTTFTIDVKYAPAPDTIDLYPLGSLTADLSWLLTVGSPGAAVPAANAVQLSGGAPGVAASGVAYTS
jgi:hypothetical protein